MADNAAVSKILKKLDEQEGKTIPGARVLTPKQQLMDASEAEKRNPDKRVRWVNIKDPQKAESRKIEGYVRLTPEEGGKALGDETALFAIPREKYEQRVAAQEQLNRERLVHHEREMESVVLAVVKELRDRHGIRVNEKRLFVNED